MGSSNSQMKTLEQNLFSPCTINILYLCNFVTFALQFVSPLQIINQSTPQKNCKEGDSESIKESIETVIENSDYETDVEV